MSSATEERWHQMDVEEVLARLDTTREGLTHKEAGRRLEAYGLNQLAADEQELPLAILLRQLQSPLIYILVVAGLVTAALGNWVDTGVIFTVVVLNSVVGFTQEYKAEQALRALAEATALRARVLRDGREQEIDARRAKSPSNPIASIWPLSTTTMAGG